MNRRDFIGLTGIAAGALVLGIRPALAAKASVYEKDGLALGGTDTVAYFAGNGPVAGSAEHQVMWNGATWQFASAENLEMFNSDPEKYAPQYGGYCAYAVSKGYTASTDPDAWTLHNDRLYLNYSRSVRKIWSRDIPGNIAKGDANWPGVLA